MASAQPSAQPHSEIRTLPPTSKKIIDLLLIHDTGLPAKELISKTSIPRRTIYDNLKILIASGIVKTLGKSPAIFQLCENQSESPKIAHLLKSDKIQLHNMSFVIRLIDKPDWWGKRENKLIKLGLEDVKKVYWGNNRYAQAKLRNFMIQCHNQSIIFMASKPYWGSDPYDCFEQATMEFLECYKYVEELFKFRFFHNGIPQASVRSSHLVLLHDALAKKCKKDGDKFEVNIEGKLRMYVDMSDPLGTEAGHKNYAIADMGRYQNYVADILVEEHMKPSEVLQVVTQNALGIQQNVQTVGRLAQNFEYYSENQVTHVGLMKQIAVRLDKMDERDAKNAERDERTTQALEAIAKMLEKLNQQLDNGLQGKKTE